MGVERRIPEQDARRRRVMPKARRKGACPRASGRRGSRRVARKAGGEGNRGRHDKLASVSERGSPMHLLEKKQSAENKKEGKKRGVRPRGVVQKGEGGVMLRKKGDGEARENNLESFQSFQRVKSQPWELPQKCHVTYS